MLNFEDNSICFASNKVCPNSKDSMQLTTHMEYLYQLTKDVRCYGIVLRVYTNNLTSSRIIITTHHHNYPYSSLNLIGIKYLFYIRTINIIIVILQNYIVCFTTTMNNLCSLPCTFEIQFYQVNFPLKL